MTTKAEYKQRLTELRTRAAEARASKFNAKARIIEGKNAASQEKKRVNRYKKVDAYLNKKVSYRAILKKSPRATYVFRI